MAAKMPPTVGRGPSNVALPPPAPLPLCIKEHQTSHVVTRAGFQNRAVGVGLPETQSSITLGRDPVPPLSPTFLHDPITFQDTQPQFKLPLSESAKTTVPKNKTLKLLLLFIHGGGGECAQVSLGTDPDESAYSQGAGDITAVV